MYVSTDKCKTDIMVCHLFMLSLASVDYILMYLVVNITHMYVTKTMSII